MTRGYVDDKTCFLTLIWAQIATGTRARNSQTNRYCSQIICSTSLNAVGSAISRGSALSFPLFLTTFIIVLTCNLSICGVNSKSVELFYSVCGFSDKCWSRWRTCSSGLKAPSTSSKKTVSPTGKFFSTYVFSDWIIISIISFPVVITTRFIFLTLLDMMLSWLLVISLYTGL